MPFLLQATLNPKWNGLVLLAEEAAAAMAKEKLEQEGHNNVVVSNDDNTVKANDLVVGNEDDHETHQSRRKRIRVRPPYHETHQPRRKRIRVRPPLTAVPRLPQELEAKFKELCGENPICLILQKLLYETDVRERHARISMPFKQIKSFDFLTEEEKTMLHQEAEKLYARDRKTITVTLIYKPRTNGGDGLDDAVKETEMKLGQWNMNKKKGKSGKEKKISRMYVLNGKHKEVVEENKLDEDVEIQIWASRKTIDQKLCLALFVPEKDQEDILMIENV